MVIPPENLESGTDYTITLTASNSGGSRSYDFEFSTSEAFSGSLSINPSNSITAMVTELTLTLNGVETNSEYYFDVVVTYDTTSASKRVISATY